MVASVPSAKSAGGSKLQLAAGDEVDLVMLRGGAHGLICSMVLILGADHKER
ncbi:MAG TPA: hypothetical protein VJN18_19235 [Polyangiaceae bacterium]|nr:hypothetical protein [Polyangiaceae bacterium]